MVTQNGNTWINSQSKTIKKILPSGGTSIVPTEVVNPAGTSKLTGELVLKDFLDLEEINLDENYLEKVTFINCPKLKVISVSNNEDATGKRYLKVFDIKKLSTDSSGKPIPNALVELNCGGNMIESIDFTYCEEMVKFECPRNPSLDRIENLDKCKKVEVINMDESGPVRVMNEVKQSAFKAVAEEVKKIFRVESLGELPMEEYTDDKGRKQRRIKKGALKTQLMNEVVKIQTPQLKASKANAEKERDEAKAKLSSVEAERDQLKQQLSAMKTELGLTENANQQQALDKIKELMNRPTSGCSHTDYDNIKAERDRLKTENAKLKNDNKENVNVDAITKKNLKKETNKLFSELNISQDIKSEINNATTAERVEEVRSGIIKSEFGRLKDENNSAFRLNIGLGTLALGSLLLLGWVLMRQSKLPEMEPKKKKEK